MQSVYHRSVNADGSLAAGADSQIPYTGGTGNWLPTVAKGPPIAGTAGEALIGYERSDFETVYDDGGGYLIAASRDLPRINAAGSSDNYIQPSSAGSFGSDHVAMATNASGTTVAVWSEVKRASHVVSDTFHFQSQGVGIFAQRVGSDGVTVGPITTVSGPWGAPITYQPPDFESGVDPWSINVPFEDDAIAIDAEGNFSIARMDTDSGDILVQRFAADGSSLGNAIHIVTAFVDQVRIGADAANNLVVVWNRSVARTDSGAGVYGQRIDGSGNLVGGQFQINTYTSPDGIPQHQQYQPSLAVSPTGNFVVAWTSLVQDSDGSAGVYARAFKADGTADGAEFRVATTVAGGQVAPEVAMDADGNAIIVWVNVDLATSTVNNETRYSIADAKIVGRRYVNIAPPQVTAVRAGNDLLPVQPGQSIGAPVTQLRAQLSRNATTAGGAAGTHSITNLANWQLTRNGVDVSNQITAVTWHFDAQKERYEATLSLSSAIGADGVLDNGFYVLTALDTIQDNFGHALDGDSDGSAGGTYNFSFKVDTYTAPAPKVQGVFIGSTTWTPTFRSHLIAAGLGTTDGYAVPSGSSAQLYTVPWIGTNQVTIRFNEDVNVAQSDLVVSGLHVPNYVINGFSYNQTSHTGTWTLAQVIDKDSVTITLDGHSAGAVRDWVGNLLDGEWINQVSSYASGDGKSGGDLRFEFNVLPADLNQDGVVNGLEISNVASHWLQTSGLAGDVNGDGMINGLDIAAIASRWLQARQPLPFIQTPFAYSSPGGDLTLLADGTRFKVVNSADHSQVLAQQTIATTGRIEIDGSGATNLTLDFSGGDPLPVGGLAYYANPANANALVLQGGSVAMIAYSSTNSHDGTIAVTDAAGHALPIIYKGVSPISDLLTADGRDFQYQNDSIMPVSVTLAAGAAPGTMTLASPGAKLVTFKGPSSSMSIAESSSYGFSDTINVGGIDASFTGLLGVTAATGAIAITANALSTAGSMSLAAPSIAVNSASITTSGIQTYVGRVMLIAPSTTFSSTGSGGTGNITFDGTLIGIGRGATMSTAGAVTFNEEVDVATLNTGGTGSATFNADVTTTGYQVYDNSVTLTGANRKFTSTGSGTVGNITFNGTLAGAGTSLTVNTAGTTTLNGVVNVASLYTDTLGTTAINAVVTSPYQTYNDTVVVAGANSTFSGTSISFRKLTGPGTDVIVASGIVRFGSANVGSLSVPVQVGTVYVSGAVTTAGTQSYAGAVRIDGVTGTFTSTGAGALGDIHFGNTLMSDPDSVVQVYLLHLTLPAVVINTAGTATFDGAVSVGSLTVNAPGATVVNADITTTTRQTYNSFVVVTGPMRLFNSVAYNLGLFGMIGGNGNITFNSGLTGASTDVTVNTAGIFTLYGAVTVHTVNGAGWAGPETLVNTAYTTGVQANGAVAMDAAGDFVIAWYSEGQDGDGYGIYAQRYNAAGVPQGATIQVNDYTTGDQKVAAIAMDPNGDFVIAWNSYGQDGDGSGIYAKRYNAASVAQQVPGAAPGVTEFRVNTTTATGQGDPAIAMDTAGDFVITWSSFQLGLATEIYAQRYNAAGVAQGGEFLVNDHTVNYQRASAVAMDAAGDFVVTWESYEETPGSHWDVYAKRYNSAGVSLGNEFQVNAASTSSEQNPAIAMDANGNFLIVYNQVNVDTLDVDVLGQRFTADGMPLFGEFKAATGSQEQAVSGRAVALAPNGNFAVVFRSPDGSGNGVWASQFDWNSTATDANGQLLGTTTQINTTTQGEQAGATVAMDPAGNFVATWTSDGQDGSSYGVFARRYSIASPQVPSVLGGGGAARTSTLAGADVTTSDATIGPLAIESSSYSLFDLTHSSTAELPVANSHATAIIADTVTRPLCADLAPNEWTSLLGPRFPAARTTVREALFADLYATDDRILKDLCGRKPDRPEFDEPSAVDDQDTAIFGRGHTVWGDHDPLL